MSDQITTTHPVLIGASKKVHVSASYGLNATEGTSCGIFGGTETRPFGMTAGEPTAVTCKSCERGNRYGRGW